MNNLLQNLRQLIKVADISERELARRTGISHAVIHRILNNESINPTLQTLQALAKYFLINVSELVGEMPIPDGKYSYDHMGWSKIPVLKEPQIGLWLREERVKDDLIKTVPVDFVPNEKTFGFELTSDAMTPLFWCNDILIVDPLQKPASGAYVIFWHSDLEIEAGRLIIKSHDEYLVSNLSGVQDKKIPSSSLIGLIIQATKYI